MKRIYWLDILRIFSIISMITLHVAANYMPYENIDGYNFIVMNLYDSAVRFCVPIFLMISGALFLSKEKIDIKTLYKKNILRLLIALVFWNFIYAIFMNRQVLFPLTFSSIGNLLKTFNTYHYHLPFLCSLIGLYILSPLLNKLVKDKDLFKYFLIISIIFAVIIPTIKFFPAFADLVYGENKYTTVFYTLTNWLFKIDIPVIGSYLVYFLYGYFLYTADTSKKQNIIYFLGLLGFILTFSLTQLFSHILQATYFNFYSYNSFNVFMQASAIFIFFKEKVSKISLKPVIQKVIITLSTCSFGIYLIHEIFNMLSIKNHLASVDFNPIISIPIISISIFLISFIIIFIISKIPILKKYII